MKETEQTCESSRIEVHLQENNEDNTTVERCLRVLCVDDELCSIELTKEILSINHNFVIDGAESVKEAFKKMENNVYDAIISDFEMPHKNGLDFLKELREQKIEIPFILFTGKSREGVAVKALNLGADSYINKHGFPETVYCELADAINKTVERKKSKKLLVESEIKYRTLVEKSLQGILIAKTFPLQIVFANSAMGNILGYSTEELKSLSPLRVAGLIHDEDKAVFFNRLENRIHGEPADSSLEFRAVQKNGSIIWLEAFANRIEYLGQPAVQGMFLDITERKKVHEILRESEERYRELANSLPDIVFETDADGKLTFINDSALKLSGYSHEDFEKGLNIFQFVVPEERERAIETMRRLLARGSYTPSEYTFMRKDGSNFPSLIIATRRISRNTLTGLRGLVIDITEHKQMQNQLFEYSQKLEKLVEKRTEQLRQTQDKLVISERLAAIGELAGMVGHDLRNPLTGIKNAAYYLKINCATCAENKTKHMLEIIDKSVNHSDRIINDLMEYSREIRLDVQEISPRTLLNDSLQMLRVPSTIKILNNLTDEPKIKVDYDKIIRVFINLMKNAIDAMPNGGTLEIKTNSTKNKTKIAFIDSGTGIAEEILPKIFSPLFTTKAQGMGFGLSICKRYAEAHQGKITVKSNEGKGTTFTLILPNEPQTESDVNQQNFTFSK